MPRLRKLNKLDQLKRSGFGQPPPRHGLHLLYWFSTECVYFDANHKMIWRCDPSTEDFGFHPYWNLPDNNGAKLLPDAFKPYHTVGNLNFPNADELPEYVRRQKFSYGDGSNKDRLIISVEYDKVYVTEHLDRTNFNPRATYQIGYGLLRTISAMTKREFLKTMSYSDEESEDSDVSETAHLMDDDESDDDAPNAPITYRDYRSDYEGASPRSRRCLDCCTIL